MRISDWSSDVCSSDLMKVQLDGGRLLDIGKKLPPERVQGESIGMLYFRGDGPRRFVAALEAAMLDPAAIRQWHTNVFAALAPQVHVQTEIIRGHPLCNVDYPSDVQTALRLVAGCASYDDDETPAAAEYSLRSEENTYELESS